MLRIKMAIKFLSLSLVIAFIGADLAAAQAKKPNKKPTPKTRERIVTGETKITKDKKAIDFSEAQLYGERRGPPGTMVNLGKADKDYDLIRIRRRWHPEMVQSTSSLEIGR